MSIARTFAGRLCAAYYRAIGLGRIEGRQFVLRAPSHLRVKKGGRLVIGTDALIEKRARIVVERGATLSIGANSYVGKDATLIAFADVTIGAGVRFGEHVSVHSESHGPAGRRNDYTTAPVVIGDEVWLGAGAVVVMGVTIGENSTIGANAVVTKDLPANVTAVGVPARVRVRD